MKRVNNLDKIFKGVREIKKEVTPFKTLDENENEIEVEKIKYIVEFFKYGNLTIEIYSEFHSELQKELINYLDNLIKELNKWNKIE